MWRFAITDIWLAGLPSGNLSWCRDFGCWRFLLWGSRDKGCEGVLQGRKPCRHFWRRCVFVSGNIFCFSDLRNPTSITRKIAYVRQATVCQVDSRYKRVLCEIWGQHACKYAEVMKWGLLENNQNSGETDCLRPQRSSLLLPPFLFTLNIEAGCCSKCG